MKKFNLLVYILVLAEIASGQTLTLETPTKIQAQLGRELRVKITAGGAAKYILKMEGNPTRARIQANYFIWNPSLQDAGHYLVRILLQDSIGTTLTEAEMDLSVNQPSSPPSLQFDRPIPDTIRLIENQPFVLSGTMKSSIGSDPKSLEVYFQFNESDELRSFDSCSINRMGDQILFRWTPSNEEAEKGYAKFRITILDTDNSILNKVLSFRIASINQAPIFKYDIPDTIFIPAIGDLILDLSPKDPDNDKVKVDYFPKEAGYSLDGNKLVFHSDYQSVDPNKDFPKLLIVSASDGKVVVKKNLHIFKKNVFSRLPSIGDFTRKEFVEGDSLLTFLNLSGDVNIRDYNITMKDLALPSGVGKIVPHLEIEKESSFIKVFSMGALPYYLVDRDYNYNVAVTISSKEGKQKSVYKVLEFTVKDRPDPHSVGQQKDSLIASINQFLKVEGGYKSSLEKLQRSVNRPWWKKAAIVTGTLSGILVLVQSQDPNKTVSVLAATISLASITISNLPSLKEKTLSELNDKISNSKGRIDLVHGKESEMKSNWSFDTDHLSFDKVKSDVYELINKSQVRRNEDVCSLLKETTLKRKIAKLIKQKNSAGDKSDAQVFNCTTGP